MSTPGSSNPARPPDTALLNDAHLPSLPATTAPPAPLIPADPAPSRGGPLTALAAHRAREFAQSAGPSRNLPDPTNLSSLPSIPSMPPPPRAPSSQILLVLVGLPGSGKSTFASALAAHGWVRASQDDSASGKRAEVEAVVQSALLAGHNVVVDRVNFDADQRAHFVHLAQSLPSPPRLWALVLRPPESVLRARLAVREGHPTLRDPAQALAVLGRMGRAFAFPAPEEGFERVLILDGWEVGREEEVLARIGREGGRGVRPRGRGRGTGRGRGRGGYTERPERDWDRPREAYRGAHRGYRGDRGRGGYRGAHRGHGRAYPDRRDERSEAVYRPPDAAGGPAAGGSLPPPLPPAGLPPRPA